MKVFGIVLYVVVISLFAIVGCNKHQGTSIRPNRHMQAYHFIFNKHHYISFTDTLSYDSVSIVHSPDCPCEKQNDTE